MSWYIIVSHWIIDLRLCVHVCVCWQISKFPSIHTSWFIWFIQLFFHTIFECLFTVKWPNGLASMNHFFLFIFHCIGHSCVYIYILIQNGGDRVFNWKCVGYTYIELLIQTTKELRIESNEWRLHNRQPPINVWLSIVNVSSKVLTCAAFSIEGSEAKRKPELTLFSTLSANDQ